MNEAVQDMNEKVQDMNEVQDMIEVQDVNEEVQENEVQDIDALFPRMTACQEPPLRRPMKWLSSFACNLQVLS